MESAKHERLKDFKTIAAIESRRALNTKRFFCCCSGCGCLCAKRQFNNLKKMQDVPGWRICMYGFFFTPPERVTLPT